MQNILNKSERQRLEDHFAGEYFVDSLFAVCLNVFGERAAKLEGVKADYEDIFRQVVRVLYFLTIDIEPITQRDVDDLWTSILMQVREWPNATVNDRKIIADTVFRIVRKLLCHHWDTYYSDVIYDMFNKTIERESAYGDMEEIQRFQKRLSEHGEQLSDWINTFYDSHLYDEVEAIIKGQAEIKVKKRSGRKSVDPNDIMVSFNYLPRVEYRVERLQAFFDCLNNVFVDCDKKDFVDMFQGKSTTDKILWIRDIKELQYLINKLSDPKLELISWPKSYTKWQMTCARFQIRVKQKKVDVNEKEDCFVIKDLKLTQFNKGSKALSSHDELDRIMKILDPKTDYGLVLEDYLNYKEALGEHDEINDVVDALANGLNTDIRF